MGIAPWSPLAGGVLTGKYNNGRPPGSRGAESQWLDRLLVPTNLERVRDFCTLAREEGEQPETLALAWLLHNQGVDTVIMGATRIEHVDNNIRAANVDLSPSLYETIAQLFTAGGTP